MLANWENGLEILCVKIEINVKRRLIFALSFVFIICTFRWATMNQNVPQKKENDSQMCLSLHKVWILWRIPLQNNKRKIARKEEIRRTRSNCSSAFTGVDLLHPQIGCSFFCFFFFVGQSTDICVQIRLVGPCIILFILFKLQRNSHDFCTFFVTSIYLLLIDIYLFFLLPKIDYRNIRSFVVTFRKHLIRFRFEFWDFLFQAQSIVLVQWFDPYEQQKRREKKLIFLRKCASIDKCTQMSTKRLLIN